MAVGSVIRSWANDFVRSCVQWLLQVKRALTKHGKRASVRSSRMIYNVPQCK